MKPKLTRGLEPGGSCRFWNRVGGEGQGAEQMLEVVPGYFTPDYSRLQWHLLAATGYKSTFVGWTRG